MTKIKSSGEKKKDRTPQSLQPLKKCMTGEKRKESDTHYHSC